MKHQQLMQTARHPSICFFCLAIYGYVLTSQRLALVPIFTTARKLVSSIATQVTMAYHSAKSVEDLRFKDDGLTTITSEEQEKVENSVARNYLAYMRVSNLDPDLSLYRQKHVQYLKRGLHDLSQSYECLDASRPWLCYWILHGLEMLNVQLGGEEYAQTADFLKRCQDPYGGFCGGPQQIPHLAPTYAAVCALCIVGTRQAYDVINRPKLKTFLASCRTAEGSFTMHQDGEVDIRGAYCAVVAAHLTNIMTPELFEGTAEWIAKCQTYEGGFSGEPGLEAHGGYTFCGYAALVLLGKHHLIDNKRLLTWVTRRQMRLEGGFQGRTNKLVDGCYSFWQGGVFPLLHTVIDASGNGHLLSNEKWMFDQVALQDYLLMNCQLHHGGLVDKPGKSRDFYHTCYCLSGLSVAQHFVNEYQTKLTLVGGQDNKLAPVHPVYNIGVQHAADALKYFRKLPLI